MSYCNCCGAERLKEQHDSECIYHGANDNLTEDRTIKWPKEVKVSGVSFIPKGIR